jgi:hypothetical protein
LIHVEAEPKLLLTQPHLLLPYYFTNSNTRSRYNANFHVSVFEKRIYLHFADATGAAIQVQTFDLFAPKEIITKAIE